MKSVLLSLSIQKKREQKRNPRRNAAAAAAAASVSVFAGSTWAKKCVLRLLPWGQTSGQRCHRGTEPRARRPPEQAARSSCEFWYGFPEGSRGERINYRPHYIHFSSRCCLHTCTIRIADLIPDWICPKWTIPVTPTTSSIPSQWLGFENLSLVSWPQALAPDAQLENKPELKNMGKNKTSRSGIGTVLVNLPTSWCWGWWCPRRWGAQWASRRLLAGSLCACSCRTWPPSSYWRPPRSRRSCCACGSWTSRAAPPAWCGSPGRRPRLARCRSSCSWRRFGRYPRSSGR